MLTKKSHQSGSIENRLLAQGEAMKKRRQAKIDQEDKENQMRINRVKQKRPARKILLQNIYQS